MNRFHASFGAGCAGLACLILAAGAQAADRPAPVPPTLEIEILDPNVDPVGNPAVLHAVDPDGQTRITIPPTALVHRYYYTGDRSFQGPLLTGGPVVVVVNHPRTAERLYIPVQMLPGAPRVTYTDHSIEYDFHTQAVTIEFPWLCCKPKVVYRNGVPVGQRVKQGFAAVGGCGKRLIERTGLPEVTDKVCDGAKNVVETAADHTHDLGQMAAAPITQVVQLIPGIKMLTSTPEERAERLRDAEVKRAQAKQERDDTIFLKTNR
jgi:hypothetical protein